MATIYDHRPKTAGAGSGMSPWTGAGIGAGIAHAQTQQDKLAQAELDKAASLEAEYQSRQRVRDNQLALQQRATEQQAATDRAMREGLAAGGGRYEEIVGRLSVEQKAAMNRWLADPNVVPEFIQRQLDDWGAQFDLQDLMEDVETLEGYAAGIGSDPESGEEGPQMEAAQGVLESFKAGEMDFSQAATELAEMGRKVHVEQRAGAQREAAILKSEEMILKADPETTGLDPEDENYDEIVDILAQINNGVTMVKSPDKDKGMVPKGYKALISELEILLNPSLVDAVKAREQRRTDEQMEMEQDNPLVYEELLRKTGRPVKPTDFMEAKKALDLGGLTGLRQHLGIGFAAEAEQLQAAGHEGHPMGSVFVPPGVQEFKKNPFEAPTPGKPRKLAQLKGEARAAAMRTLASAVEAIDIAGMSGKDFEKEVVKQAKAAGVVATFGELMEAIESAGAPPEKPLRSRGSSWTGKGAEKKVN